MSDVTIHIDETLESSTIQAIQFDLSRISGIKNISSEEKNPHLMVVTYDETRVSSDTILGLFTGQGLHAELIGF